MIINFFQHIIRQLLFHPSSFYSPNLLVVKRYFSRDISFTFYTEVVPIKEEETKSRWQSTKLASDWRNKNGSGKEGERYRGGTDERVLRDCEHGGPAANASYPWVARMQYDRNGATCQLPRLVRQRTRDTSDSTRQDRKWYSESSALFLKKASPLPHRARIHAEDING